MAGYSSAFDLGREVAVDGIADPGDAGTVELSGKSGGTLVIASASATNGVVVPTAPAGTSMFLVNQTGGNVTISDQSGVIITVATATVGLVVSRLEGASYIWVGTAIATHA